MLQLLTKFGRQEHVLVVVWPQAHMVVIINTQGIQIAVLVGRRTYKEQLQVLSSLLDA
jgi:hypothetical protein